MKKLLVSAIFLAVASAVAFGQKISVQAPNLVSLNERFTVAFVVDGDGHVSDFSWDSGSDFSLVWGPSKSSSSSISIINGKTTKTSQQTFSYILMPKSVGKFQLPAASARIGGKEVSSVSVTVEVVSDGAAASSGTSASPQGASSGTPAASGKPAETGAEDIFLRLLFNKTKVIVGEPVTATLKLYSRAELAGCEDATFPSFDGFWSEEVPSSGNLQFQREKVGDLIYNAAVVRRWVLTPQKAGDVVVEPAELLCVLNVLARRAPTGSIFDSFFQDDVQQVRKRLTTARTTIHVSDLPAGAPASFGGAVGSFKMSAALSRDSLKTHDAASVTVTLSGTGNMSMIKAPKLSFPPDFEAYDVKISDRDGARVFEYPFIPRSSGDFVIEPVRFSYFDLASRKYVTLSGKPMPVSVAKGSEDTPAAVSTAPGVVQKGIKDLGSDIRYISTSRPSFRRGGNMFAGSGLFWTIALLIVLLGGAIWAALRSAAARRADVAATRGRGATKMARRRLAAAAGYLKNNLGSAFYEELHRALLGYIGDKLNMEAVDMSRENILEKLSESSVPDGVVREFCDLLDACEYARYAPDSGTEAMNSHYQTAVNVISTMDSSIKTPRRSPASRIAAVSALLFIGLSSFAQNAAPDSLWTEGCSLYAAGRWADAADCWEEICDSGFESSELYYNIGNACFKDGRLASSIVFYRRALKLDPSNSDARFNLEFARTRRPDKIETVPEFFLKGWFRNFCYVLPPEVWSVLFLLFLASTVALILVFLLGARLSWRKFGFFTSIATLLAAALCLSFALKQKKEFVARDQAVVVMSVAPVKSSPGDDVSTNLFLLHEGTEVEILEEVGNWVRVVLPDGRQGWLKMSDLEIV